MLFGQDNVQSAHQILLTHPVWKEAFTWIKEHANAMPEGEHEIAGRDMYANVQSLATLSVSEAAFEVHQQYIDIHYCLRGGEVIGYAPMGNLKEKKALDTEKDYQLFNPSEQYSTCILQPGYFAIFFPQELHMPKLANGLDTHVSKVVIKINKDLFV